MFPKIDENFSNIKTVQLKIYIYIYISALFFILLINLKIKEMYLYIPGILNVLQNIIQLLVLNLKFYASGFVCEHACVKDVRGKYM